MKNLALLLLLFAASCSTEEQTSPTVSHHGPLATKSLELAENEIPFFTMAGQSNMTGIATPRLANTLDYPTYSATPEGVYIYAKGPTASLADQQADNGQWQPLVMGANNGLPYNVGLPDFMGLEMTLGPTMRDLTGKPVYIIKAAFNGTGITSTLQYTNPPGNWNNTNRTIFYINHVKPALLQFRKDNPGMVPVWVGHLWWGGEKDVQKQVSKVTFKTQFQSMMNYMLDSGATQFGHYPRSVHVMGLNAWSNTNEVLLTQGLAEKCDENGWVFWPTTIYKKNAQLTAVECAPVPKGCLNSTGACDDTHMGHRAYKALGPSIATYCYNN